MKQWLGNKVKVWLGVDILKTELEKLRKEKSALENEVEVFRKAEAADAEKYDSPNPWVELRSADFDETRGTRIELDWNDAFIQQLKESGIKGSCDEEFVQKWLAFLYQEVIQRLEEKVVDIKDDDKQSGKKISDYQ